MNQDERMELGNAITRLQTKLQALSPESEDYAKVADQLDKLYKMQLDYQTRIFEGNLKKAETEANIKNKETQNTQGWVKIATDAAISVGSVAFLGYWMGKGFQFEEHGAITSFTFRDLWRKLPRLGR